MVEVLDEKEALPYAKFLKKFEEKTVQILRIKKQLDERLIAIIDKLKDDMQNPSLLASLDDLRKKEERIKNYVKKGLYMVEGDVMPKLEASKKRAVDIEKLKFVIKIYQRIVAKVILRLRKEHHFIENPSEKNFKKFIRMYYKELKLGNKILDELINLRIADVDIGPVITSFIGGGTASLVLANVGPGGAISLVVWASVTLLALALVYTNYDKRKFEYIEKLKKRYGFSLF